MGSVTVDLRNSTVNGKKVMPRVAELVFCLLTYPNLDTDGLIQKVYGPYEPENARNCIKQTAWHARKAGIAVTTDKKGPNARYILSEAKELA